MAYSKYYSDGWKNNAEGNTPITAEALNHMENGIVSANNIVTTTAAGLMSAQDKSKLNGITAGAAVTGVKGNAENSYRSGNINLTAANIGALPSNTILVSRVKGNAEVSYRSGDVNLTPANIGAVAKSGDTMTGVLRRASNLNYDTTPAMNETSEVLQGLDASNLVRFRIYQSVNTNGTKNLYIMARDDDGNGTMSNYNLLGIGLTSNGEPVYTLSSSSGSAVKAFMRALGLGTSDGSLPIQVSQGGTGITSNPSMLVNLNSGSAANVMQASPRPGVTGTLGVANGGTNASTAPGARSNLGAAQVIILNGNTWSGTSGLKAVLENLDVGRAANFYSSAGNDGATYALTGGKTSARLQGTVYRDDSGTYSFFGAPTGASSPINIYNWRVSNVTTTGATIGSVARFTGALI